MELVQLLKKYTFANSSSFYGRSKYKPGVALNLTTTIPATSRSDWKIIKDCDELYMF